MHIRHVSNPELVPVVELEPGNFGAAECPPGPWSDEQCARYWRDCLTQAGLGHLIPVRPRSWQVPLDELLDRSVLRRVIRAHVEETDDDSDAAPFPGGFALYDGTEPLLLPQCCGDMGDLDEWQRASSVRDCAHLWLGHPQLLVKYVRPHLELRGTAESPNEGYAPAAVTVDPYALAGAVERARAHLMNLVPLLAASLAPADFATPEAAAATMLGLEPPTSR